MTNPAALHPPVSGSDGAETVATVAPRMTMLQLLHRPFDVRCFALNGLFILALFYTIYFARAVLLPVVLALLLSFLLAPLVRAFAKLHIRPALSAAVLMLSLVAGLGYAVTFLATPAAGWIEKAPYGIQQIQRKLLPLKKPMEQVAQASGEIDKLASPAANDGTKAVEVKQHRMADMLSSTPEFLFSAVLMLILVYFLLAYDGVFLGKVVKTLPRFKDKKRAVCILQEIEQHVSRYLLTVTLINTGLGIAVGTTVGLLGLRNPIMWGALVAVLNFVPYLGALTGILCMTIGAVLSFDNISYAMVFPACYLALATIEGNLVTPWVMGRSLTLNPVIILLSITFWGWLWGIAGIILAVPILAAFKIFCTHIEQLEPVAEFLS
ncbi:MAG TPA: AI-2E family transporter [Chthoniobacterales bacterium]